MAFRMPETKECHYCGTELIFCENCCEIIVKTRKGDWALRGGDVKCKGFDGEVPANGQHSPKWVHAE